jgi:hypothetical protein
MPTNPERGESSPTPPFEAAFFKARKILTHPDNYVWPKDAHVEEDGEDFQMGMTLKGVNLIEAESKRGRMTVRILMFGEKKISFTISKKDGLMSLVFFGSQLTVWDRTVDLGVKIGIGTSEASYNPVPPEKHQQFAQMATPLVEWLENTVRRGELIEPPEIRPQ